MPEQLREHFANKAKHDGKHGDKEKMEKRKEALRKAKKVKAAGKKA